MSSNDFDFTNLGPPSPEISGFTSSMNSIVTASIVLSVVGTAATVAVVYFLIDCLKKMGTAIPAYAKVAMDYPENPSMNRHSQENPPVPRVVIPSLGRDAQGGSDEFEFETMERFMKPKRFSSEEVSAFTEDFSTVLGSGAYGVVFKGELPNGMPVAVKILTRAADKRADEQFMAEVSSIGKTHHINLVRLYGFCFDSTTRALIYEFMENGSLDRLLFGEGVTRIDWARLREIAIGTAKGIAYLHEECHTRIVHYDIKPGNVLLDRNLSPKLADFGLAKLCNRDSTHIEMTGFRGTPGYAAPEVWKPFPITFKCDVYSYGMLLFEIVGQRKNHVESNQPESRQWLPRWTWDMFQHDELPLMVSLFGISEKDRTEAERMLKIALLCIQYLPESRPLMSSVVKMLEGDVDIPSPLYPFEYMDQKKPYSGSQGGRSFDTDDSTIRTVYSNGTCSKLNKGNPLEIEMSSS